MLRRAHRTSPGPTSASRPGNRVLRACFIALLLTFTATYAHAAPLDFVYGSSDVTGGVNGFPFTTDPLSLSFSSTGTGEQGQGTASGSAFLGNGPTAPGNLKTSISAETLGCCLAGQANARVGLSAEILFTGPADVDGLWVVTMHLTGSYGCCGPFDGMQIYAQTGPGIAGQIGFATSDPALRGDFILNESGFAGTSITCNNCSYAANGYFPIEVTAYLPFEAGQTSVIYAAELMISTAAHIGSSTFVDASHTALFSIQGPTGFTYSSALSFIQPQQVSAPATILLVLGGLVVSGIASRYRSRRHR